jgi:hypothetical protein
MKDGHSSEANSTLSQSNSSPFVEPNGSLPWSQETATGPYPKPEESNPQPSRLFPHYPFKYFSPPTDTSSEWSLPFRLSDQNCVRISNTPSRFSTFDSNSICEE